MNRDFYITKLHAVLELEWSAKEAYANPRPFHALSVRLEGNADFFHEREVYHLDRHDILFMPKNYGYLLRANKNEKLLCVHFDTDRPISETPLVFKPRHPASFIQYFQLMNDARGGSADANAFSALSCLYRIFQGLTEETDNKKRGLSRRQLLEPAFQYIYAQFKDPEIQVETLANLCSVSPAYFRRIFKEETRFSPKDYISDFRIRYAKELLGSGLYSVLETANACGMPNVKFFSTFFRQKTGITPSEYKKTQRPLDLRDF